MIPPLMSSTLNGEDILGTNKQDNTNKNQNNTTNNSGKNINQQQSSGEAGRPEKDDSQKSEKTIQNRESMS